MINRKALIFVVTLLISLPVMAAPTESGHVVVDSSGVALPSVRVSGSATTTNTADVSLVAASGSATLKTYITGCQFANTGSTTALITLKDGNGGSTLATTIAPTGGGSNVRYDIPLVTTANTALYFAAGSSSTTIYGSCQGYKAQ